MLYYVSTPTGRSRLDVCRAHGFREMSCPVEWRKAGYVRKRNLRVRLDHYALDNGAWIFHVAGQPVEWTHFARALAEMGASADFVVVPDIVAGGAESLAMSSEWLPRVLAASSLALVPVQDGMSTAELEPMLGGRVGLFVGGSFAWKWSTLPQWAALAHRVGCYIHVGRVNTRARASMCADLRVHSADGSTVARFPDTASRFVDAINPDRKGQENMPW